MALAADGFAPGCLLNAQTLENIEGGRQSSMALCPKSVRICRSRQWSDEQQEPESEYAVTSPLCVCVIDVFMP